MDENSKKIVDGLGAVAKQNREMNEHLKKLTKPTSLKESIQDNQGEILITAAMGALESKVDKQIAKSQNLGVGVMAKAGVDAIPGEEPVVDEKETLYGIVKQFYGRFNFGNLIGLTKQNLKTNDKVLQGFQNLNKSTEKSNEDRLNIFKKMSKFFSEEGEGFTGGFKQGLGIPQLVKKMSGFVESFKGFKKNFPMRAGLAVAKGVKLPFLVIASGLKKLGSTLLKPLGSIVKGIAKLPGKILGFFGGAFSLIGRLALLGGGIFALSKLTDYLRGVGPGGQESFVDMLMLAFDKVKIVFKFLKDIITDTVIPAMFALGEAIFQVIAFLSPIIPDLTITKGNARSAERRIRKKFQDRGRMIVFDEELGRPRAMNDEEYEAFIQKKIAEDKEERLRTLAIKKTNRAVFARPLTKAQREEFIKNTMEKLRPEFERQEQRQVIVGGDVVYSDDATVDSKIANLKNELRLIEEKRTGGGNAVVGTTITTYNDNHQAFGMDRKSYNIMLDRHYYASQNN